MRGTTVTLVAAAILLALAPASPGAEPREWSVEITPYIWLLGLSGDATVNGYKVDFDRSTSDFLAAAKLAGSVLGIVEYDDFLFWTQVDYYSLRTDKMKVEDQPRGGTFNIDMILGEAALGYRIEGWAKQQTFDLLLGVRTLHLKNELELTGGGSATRKSDVIDPIFVVRPCITLFPKTLPGLVLNPTLAIGGGGDSDLIYELYFQIQYEITDYLAARAGYRTVGYRFSGGRNDSALDAQLRGIMFGLGVLF
ncbi:MAG TPA: hypothetical protein PKW95_22925 [bacterium]|mgnify:CR=1 FL=1|nr:hypothetical protein [bacterium]HPQ71994.1 hypothetical protein [bacterium]